MTNERGLAGRGARRCFRIGLVALAAACAGTPATEEQARMGERQLLLPYLQQRVVACSELTVEMTGNFLPNVSNPGVDPTMHRFERTDREGVVEKVWTNLTGDRKGWMTVTIGERGDVADVGGAAGPRTTFKVMNQFRLLVRGSGVMALDARAEGPVVVVEEAGLAARPVVSFRVAEGTVQR